MSIELTGRSLGSILRILVGGGPALVTVFFVGVVAVIALVLDKDRRQYALDFVDRCIDLAAVLVGTRSRPKVRLRREGDAGPNHAA